MTLQHTRGSIALVYLHRTVGARMAVGDVTVTARRTDGAATGGRRVALYTTYRRLPWARHKTFTLGSDTAPCIPSLPVRVCGGGHTNFSSWWLDRPWRGRMHRSRRSVAEPAHSGTGRRGSGRAITVTMSQTSCTCEGGCGGGLCSLQP
jgi:hypothetical protein